MTSHLKHDNLGGGALAKAIVAASSLAFAQSDFCCSYFSLQGCLHT